jgi:sialate O-acetylesterase
LGWALATAALASSPVGRAAEIKKVACLGDSITAGVGAGPGFSYPEQLQELLGSDWIVRNFGVSARTLMRRGDYPYRNERAIGEARDFSPAVVIIVLGTNDTKPRNWSDAREFGSDYAALVKAVQAWPSRPRVWAAYPPPVAGSGNYGINEETLALELPVIANVARSCGASVLDLHSAIPPRVEFLPDRVHPNAEGAGRLAQAVYQQLTGLPAPEPTRPNSLFRDHAVLQRNVPLRVWGTAANGRRVTVEFAGRQAVAQAEGGAWSVTLPALPASSTPQTLTIASATRVIRIQDVLVGDVWLAGGQSNMERHLSPNPAQQDLVGWKADVANAKFPQLREYAVPQHFTAAPQADAGGRWEVCSPATAGSFSAVAFYFGRSLLTSIGVPIGIIHSSWGGTPIEAWMSEAELASMGSLPDRSGKNQYAPSGPYDAMIAPLAQFPIRGVIWYQGEANNQHPVEYRGLLAGLIAEWRALWKSPQLPFLFVQLAPYEHTDPRLRESQRLVAESTPKTALVVTTDLGDPHDIHPPNKRPVGERLALAARAIAYGEPIEYSGPRVLRVTVAGPRILVHFDHTGGKLATGNGGPAAGFMVAGPDGQFYSAEARIEGDQISISSARVPDPRSVRYGWASVPMGNLVNADGLPASPFQANVP